MAFTGRRQEESCGNGESDQRWKVRVQTEDYWARSPGAPMKGGPTAMLPGGAQGLLPIQMNLELGQSPRQAAMERRRRLQEAGPPQLSDAGRALGPWSNAGDSLAKSMQPWATSAAGEVCLSPGRPNGARSGCSRRLVDRALSIGTGSSQLGGAPEVRMRGYELAAPSVTPWSARRASGGRAASGSRVIAGIAEERHRRIAAELEASRLQVQHGL